MGNDNKLQRFLLHIKIIVQICKYTTLGSWRYLLSCYIITTACLTYIYKATFKLFHLSFSFPLEYIDQPLNRFNEIYDVIVAGVMRRNALKCTCFVRGRKEGGYIWNIVCTKWIICVWPNLIEWRDGDFR